MSIKYLRERQQKSGGVRYYLELPSSTGRQEIALGPDKAMALKKRQSLLFKHLYESRTETDDALFAIKTFSAILVPTLKESTKKENTRTISKLIAFIEAHPELSFADIPSPTFEEVYSFWRGQDFNLVTQNEVALARRIYATYLKWMTQMHGTCD